MSYTAWSVVFGEQPTAAKWNQLGQNDAGFRDGTNFLDDIIDSRHYVDGSIDPQHLAAEVGNWERLGRAVASGGANPTSLDTGTFAAKKFLKIFVVQHSGGVTLTSGLRFNNDSGNNYQYRTNENGTESTGASQSFIQMGSNALTGMILDYNVINEAAYHKLLHGAESFWDASNIYRNSFAAKWNNASNQITRVTAVATAGSFKDGSELVVYGRD